MLSPYTFAIQRIHSERTSRIHSANCTCTQKRPIPVSKEADTFAIQRIHLERTSRIHSANCTCTQQGKKRPITRQEETYNKAIQRIHPERIHSADCTCTQQAAPLSLITNPRPPIPPTAVKVLFSVML
jgi:hypothetical protein